MLYLAAILSLAGQPAPTHAKEPAAIVASRMLLDSAAAIATVDLAGEVERKLVELRPAHAPILRR